jgi:hypothetical protein
VDFQQQLEENGFSWEAGFQWRGDVSCVW